MWKTTIYLLVILLFNAPLTSVTYGASVLSFSPQRITIKGHKRTASLRLSNKGNETGTFRISLSDVIYKEDGSIEHTNTPPTGFPSARPFVRFSPRQVRLAPGETQLIRIMLQNTGSISNGEPSPIRNESESSLVFQYGMSLN